MNVLELVRPELRGFTPYASARTESTQRAVMLNANESPWPPEGHAGLNRYPEPQPAALRERLARLYGVRAGQVLMGRGSDEAIDLLLRAFCRPGRDAVVICPPTFGMYAVGAALQGAKVVEAPLAGDAFTLDAAAVLAACTPATKLVFLCSPNNPTGGMVPLPVVARLAAALCGRALPVVDEAYAEFADAPGAATLLDRHPNLAVLRTLSKAWGLAGARVGSLLADAEIVRLLGSIMSPYPLPTPSVDAALAVLGGDGEQRMRQRVALLVAERERLRAALARLPEVRTVLPSQANFLAVRFADAADAYRRLLAQGIVVRDVTRHPGLDDALRISIGTPQENRRLLQALRMESAA